MTRRCSHCSSDGHNSRTCPSRSTTTAPPTSDTINGGGGGVRLFGVRLTDGLIMKKSASMGNLAGHYASSSSSSVSAANAVLANPNSPLSDTIGNGRGRLEGYVSDDPGHVDRRTDRKRGTPWTEEEHRLFLIGLQKLGKGDWRGIARKYVITRTPTQVASHAQKHFIRQSNNGRRKRRTSLFDMTPDMETDVPPAQERFLPPPETTETNQENSISHSNENLESQPMEVTTDETVKESDDIPVQSSYIIPVPVDNLPVQPSYLMHVPVLPAFYPAYVPVPFRFWSPNLAPTQEENPGTSSNHQIVRPVPVIPKDPIDVVGMSQLTLTETRNGPSNFHPLSKQPLGSPSRQSAFKPRRSSSVPNLTQAYAADAAAE